MTGMSNAFAASAIPAIAFLQLVLDVRSFRVPEIQTVRQRYRLSSDTRQITTRLGDRDRRTHPRFKIDETPIPVGRDGKRALRPLDSQKSRITARRDHRVVLHLMVVLTPHCMFRSDVRSCQQPE